MNCWSFTKRSWGSPVGLGLPPAARPAVPCKIMGIGSAGCDSALHAAQSGTVLTNAEWVADGCGDDIAMDDFLAAQHKRIAVCLRSLMEGAPDAIDRPFRPPESCRKVIAWAREHITKNGRFTEALIAFAPQKMALLTEIDEVCGRIGISDTALGRWRRKYCGLLPTALRRLRQLEDENAKLKCLVASMSLDKAMLQDGLGGSDEASPMRELNTDLMQQFGAPMRESVVRCHAPRRTPYARLVHANECRQTGKV